jgi:hypothetical protein
MPAVKPLPNPLADKMLTPFEKQAFRIGHRLGWDARMTSSEVIPQHKNSMFRIGYLLGYSGINPHLTQ